MHEPHVPVLAEAVVRFAVPAPGEWYVVDATVGAGGHAALILRAVGPAGRLLGIDRDEDALAIARERLAPFGDQVRLVHGNLAELGALVSEHGWGRT
ncbi:MAG: 16S rRNA (cytosine(1402)-N(4))-methyltransferase, partial [Actinomycetota bacterium]